MQITTSHFHTAYLIKPTTGLFYDVQGNPMFMEPVRKNPIHPREMEQSPSLFRTSGFVLGPLLEDHSRIYYDPNCTHQYDAINHAATRILVPLGFTPSVTQGAKMDVVYGNVWWIPAEDPPFEVCEDYPHGLFINLFSK